MPVIEPGMQPLKIQDVKLELVEKYHFRFEQWGWMNVFIHEMGPRGSSGYGCGELVIHSDWGTWAYVWTGIDEGKILKQFLVEADCDYITRKLMGNRGDKEWDPEATRAALMRELCEEHHRATDAELIRAIAACDWDSGETLWVERAPAELHDLFDPLYEHIVYRPTIEWTVLKEGLLPALKAHLKSLLELTDVPRRNGMGVVP